MKKILIREACIYDPAQNWRGETRDLYLQDGKVSEPFSDPEHVIRAAGRTLMAGGIEPHAQLAAPGQLLARVADRAPGPEELGERYARLGYVHVHQPFTTLLTGGMVRESLGRIPYVDKSIGVSIDLRDMAPGIRADDTEGFRRQARALARVAGAQSLFVPFPFLRYAQRHYLHKNLSPARVLGFLARLDPAALHLPVTLWGMPGLLQNELPAPPRFHIARLAAALHSPGDLDRARKLLEAGASADLGLGDETGPVLLAYENAVPPGVLSVDMGLQNPVQFRHADPDTTRKATEMALGLLHEPREAWRLSLSLSGPFGSGPAAGEAVAWTGALGRLADGSTDLHRFACMTRLEPARALGLDDVGHLRTGARASVAIYDLAQAADRQGTAEALSSCWCLVKDGVVVLENGRFTGARPPVEIRRPRVDADVSACADTDLFMHPTLSVEHLGA